MSQKMPLTDLLTESFSFGFNRYVTVLRCLLVPYVIIFVGIIALIIGLLDFEGILALDDIAEPESIADVFALLGSMFRFSLGTTMGLFILGAVVLSLPFLGGIASIFRLVGLGEEPGGWFTVRLDGPMWRVFFSYLIVTVIQYAIYGATFALAWSMNPDMFSVFQNFEMVDEDPSQLISFVGSVGLAMLMAFLLMMFIFTKLAPFPAASACENRLMLINSWTKTSGHFWTILGGYILLILALGVVNLGFQLITAVAQGLIEFLSAMGVGSEFMVGIVAILVIVASIAFSIFMTGVQMAFPAAIYRRLWRE